ncbi:MAG TPA: hypothetical protein VE958_13385 [Bryobacteraceae bacterium]|jgi:hypothetical protein|nr:hypothetical protein [Bryobacteraceae bacterium]
MSPGTKLILLGAVGAGTIGFGARLALRMMRANPEKRERKRRLELHRHGRLGDALITEATDAMLYYSYSVRGVQYEASQDLNGLRHLLPTEPERLIGPASLKYSSKNPGNSILICEEWSGLRAPSRAA